MAGNVPVGIDENGRLPGEARAAIAADLLDPDSELGAVVDAAVDAVAGDPASALAARLAGTFASRLASLANMFSSAPKAYPGGLSTDAPTVVVSTSSGITGQQLYPVQGGTFARELVSRGDWENSNNRLKTQYRGAPFTGLSVTVEGSRVEFQGVAATTAVKYLIFVDGKPTAATFISAASTTGADIYLRLTFGSSGFRVVDIYVTDLVAWKGVKADKVAGVLPGPRKPLIAWVGDSFLSDNAAAQAEESCAWVATQMLGCEYVATSYGGKGYTAGADPYGSADRVAFVAEANPDLIVIMGSINDNGATGITEAATACYDAYKAACPGVPIIVIGPQPTADGTTIGASEAANIAAVKSAAEAHDAVIAFIDQVGTAGGVPSAWSAGTYSHGDVVTHLGAVWRVAMKVGGTTTTTPGVSAHWERLTFAVHGTGNAGATANDGNRDVFLGSDDTHFTAAGQRALGATYARDIARVIRGG